MEPNAEPVEAVAETREQQIARQTLERANAIAALRDSQIDMNKAVASVAMSVATLSESVEVLAKSMSTKASKREARQWPIILMCVLMVALGFIFVRSNQNHAVLNRFAECTTPGNDQPPNTGHKCFDDSVARTTAIQLQIDCNNEALLRYYLRSIPGVPLPSIRTQCQGALVPATGSSPTPTTTVPTG